MKACSETEMMNEHPGGKQTGAMGVIVLLFTRRTAGCRCSTGNVSDSVQIAEFAQLLFQVFGDVLVGFLGRIRRTDHVRADLTGMPVPLVGGADELSEGHAQPAPGRLRKRATGGV